MSLPTTFSSIKPHSRPAWTAVTTGDSTRDRSRGGTGMSHRFSQTSAQNAKLGGQEGRGSPDFIKKRLFHAAVSRTACALDKSRTRPIQDLVRPYEVKRDKPW